MKYLNYFESKKDKFPKYKQFEKDGFIIYVGGDGASNDYLTFKMANDNDIWLHTIGIQGTHVIIKSKGSNYLQETSLPTEGVIRYAAELAKKNSKADKEQPCSVRFCQRKFVYKTSDMKIGQVGVKKQIEEDPNTKIVI